MIDEAEAAILDAEARLRASRNKTKREQFRQLRVAMGFRDDLPARERPGAAGVGPTPETRMKRRYDTITRLGERLNAHQHRAADEIRAVFEAIETSLMPPRADNHGDLVDCSRKPRDAIDRMPPHIAQAWERRYIPWTRQVHRPAPARSYVTVGGLVMAVAIDNAALKWCEAHWRMNRGSAFDVLSGALNEYAVIAGWERKNA